MTDRPDVCAQARALLRDAAEVYRGSAELHRRIQDHLDRLDGPVRVAIAGKIKAGKSTLLNALVGEIVAATDAGECTRIVTWYQDAPRPRITLHPRKGDPRELPIRRREGTLTIELGAVNPAEVDRLVVDWPSRSLATMSLIDTPGIGSLSTDVSARTTAFLTPEEQEQGSADAIVYLMRHVHADDIGFLESFHDSDVAGASPVNTLAVLSRADEIGGARADSLFSAKGIARRYRQDPKIRSLCQTVVAVAGLLAETGRTLRQDEFSALARLAHADRDTVDAMLLTADRFTRELPATADLPSAAVRSALLARLGMFGLRIALPMIRQGTADSTALADELVRRSGLDELREVLGALFAERGDVLKARSALIALDVIVRQFPEPGSAALGAEIERIMSSAHEFVELGLLGSLRAGAVRLPEAWTTEAELLLGGSGQRPHARLGLAADTDAAALRTAAKDALDRWRPRAESALANRATNDAAQVIIRSCEGILSRLPV